MSHPKIILQTNEQLMKKMIEHTFSQQSLEDIEPGKTLANTLDSFEKAEAMMDQMKLSRIIDLFGKLCVLSEKETKRAGILVHCIDNPNMFDILRATGIL